MPSYTYKYHVVLPKGLELVVEMHNRPVDFTIIFPGGKELVFSRGQDTDKAVPGTVTPSPGLLSKPDVVRGGRKYRKLQLGGDSEMSVEYADPSDPVMT